MEQIVETPDKAFLSLHVRALEQSKGLYAYSVKLSLDVEVVLVRGQHLSIPIYATSWQTGVERLAGLYGLNELRESIDACVDEFINDYLAAQGGGQKPDMFLSNQKRESHL